MKSKVAISLVLAVAMVFALAMPVMARPQKGSLPPNTQVESSSASATFTLSATRDGQAKLSLVIKGAQPSFTYYVKILDVVPYGLYPVGDGQFTTDAKGNARFRGVTSKPGGFADPDTIAIYVQDVGGTTMGINHFWVGLVDVPF